MKADHTVVVPLSEIKDLLKEKLGISAHSGDIEIDVVTDQETRKDGLRLRWSVGQSGGDYWNR